LVDDGSGKYTITFTPSEYYGFPPGTKVSYINAVFNNGTWDNVGKDYSAWGGCQDFYIPLNYGGAVGDWTTYTVASDKDWGIVAFGGALETQYFAQMNGYQQSEVSDDWLISPSINMDNFVLETMDFYTQWKYGSDDTELMLKYSTNYTGGDPTVADWFVIDFEKSLDDDTWYPSGVIDISMISGANVHFAFHYYGNSGQRRWGVDEVKINGVYLSDYTEWTGANGDDWKFSVNWTNGVPDATKAALIPVTANDPYIYDDYKGTGYSAFCLSLDIQSGAGLTIDPNSNLTVSGLLINDGSLTLESDGFSVASLINNTSGVMADIQRGSFVDMVDWHLVSSPVEAATAAVFDGFYLQGYVEADNTNAMFGYYEITELGDPLNPFEGYAAFPGDGSPDMVTFSGAMNVGPFDASLTAVNAHGWNLLGNPYPCSIDWDLVTIPTNMSNEAHFIDAFFGNDISIVQGVPGDNYIPPMQGFFVSATAAETFSVDNTVKTHEGSDMYYKSEIEEMLKLKASGNNIYDKTTIHFNENAGVEHDGIYDAHKRLSLSNLELPQIFSITPAGNYLGINGLPTTEMVPVGFKAGQSGEFTIEAIETGNFTTVILEDVFTGIQTNLLNDSYTFNYNVGNNDYRFNVHFAPLAVSENMESLFNVYAYDNEIIVNAKIIENSAQVSVFNIMGQEIASDQLNGTVCKFKIEDNAVYIVKVVSESGVISKKVYVK